MEDSLLYKRIKLNALRLLDGDVYQDVLEKEPLNGWAGDFIGRYLLALSSLYQVIDDKDLKERLLSRLNDLFKQKEAKANQYHYFGDTYNYDVINEQQLAGNSWYIRSLINYYKITKDEKYYDELKCIIENFLLKLLPNYRIYPSERKSIDGWVSGHVDNQVNNTFILSSDIGCAFILLDGYVDAYEVSKDARLYEAIKEIISIFTNLDYIGLNLQTHATCTCTRAILRFYKLTGEKAYFDIAKKIFDDYLALGTTIDYQNMNLFGKPDTWTEPCCVIDSYILSHDFYLLTKEEKYLELFNRISINGIRSFQRSNGGAGCSTLLLTKESELKCFIYEAWFCCTMRFGEGLKYIANSRLIKQEDSYLMMFPSSYMDEDISINIDYYFKKQITIDSNIDTTLKIYIPNGSSVTTKKKYEIKEHLLVLKVSKGEHIDIKVKCAINIYKEAYFYGDLLLTRKDKHVDNILVIDRKEYSYVASSLKYSEEELNNLVQKL